MHDLKTAAEKIAAHLNGSWYARYVNQESIFDDYVEIVATDGSELILLLYHDIVKGLVMCGGRYPKKGNYQCGPGYYGVLNDGEEPPSIQFSICRGPDEAAKKIEEFVLPRYAELYSKCVAAKKKMEEYEAMLGFKIRGNMIEVPGGTVTVCPPNNVQINVEVSPEVAVDMLKALIPTTQS